MKRNEGMTLIEIAVASAVSIMIIGAIILFQAQFQNFNLFLSEQLENKQDISAVMQTLISEARSAAVAANGSYTIESATSTAFVFFSDLNADGITERVRYFFTTSTLSKGVTSATGSPAIYATSTETVRELVIGVTAASSSFQYFDSAYSGTQAPMTYPLNTSLIRIIKITVVANLNPSVPNEPAVFSNTINIRNLRSN